ncbi:MAG TPA: ABC-type transport auxiliary lipoprotein family protein [Terriglobia bacterium]|nr:ABC-type transport auxiliary lipoprotein family protein [Terriglobia bacterium]
MKIAKLRSSIGNSYFGILAALPLWILALLAVGCGGKIPATRYYSLRFPPPAPHTDPKTSLTLSIEPFRAAMSLRDDRIMYYESPTEFSYYEYHLWSPDPATLLAELTRRHLNEMAIFAHVHLAPSRGRVDYVLRGHLLNFDELDYVPGGKARVALELRLVRAKDQKIVWSDRREVEHSIEGSGVDGVVNALSAASDQLLSEALPGLAAEVESESAESSGKPQ